jgi:hypothetical protein
LGYKIVIISSENPYIHSFEQLWRLLLQKQSENLNIKNALFTARILLNHGCYERALPIVNSLAALNHNNETFNQILEKLTRLSEQISRIPKIDDILIDPTKVIALLSPRSCTLKGSADNRKIIIVYATPYNNFDISFPFLHHLIATKAAHIIYVKNPVRGMYGSGNFEFGKNLDEMSFNIGNLIKSLNPSDLTVMGFSGGGYAALHLAAKVKANSFLGLGIRTDYSINSPILKVNPLRASPSESDYQNNSIINLRNMPEIGNIKRAVLYYGEKDNYDREHAINMRGLSNFSIFNVKDGSHNLVLDFIQMGYFKTVLDQIID